MTGITGVDLCDRPGRSTTSVGKEKFGSDRKTLYHCGNFQFNPSSKYYLLKPRRSAVPQSLALFLMIFSAVLFFSPELGGWFLEHDNFVPANILQTPPEIVPLWYFTPYYSILRANTVNFLMVDAKIWGVIFMGLSIMVFFFLPWLDRSPAKSIRYRGWIYKSALAAFVVAFVILGYLGTKSPQAINLILFPNVYWAQIFTIVYFAFFALMPWYTKIDKTKPVPERVTK